MSRRTGTHTRRSPGHRWRSRPPGIAAASSAQFAGPGRRGPDPGVPLPTPGCAGRHQVTNVPCTPESTDICTGDPGQCWGCVDDPGAREDNPPEIVTHDGQLGRVGTIGPRKGQTKASAPGPHDVLSHEVPGRNINQPQERLLSTEGSDSRHDALGTHVPIRVRPRRVTHHQLKRVAAVGKRQRSVVCPQHIVTPAGHVVCTNVNALRTSLCYKSS